MAAAASMTLENGKGEHRWGWTDFVAHYLNPWGGGTAVSLTEIGLARDFENSNSVHGLVESFIDKVLTEAGTEGSPKVLYIKETAISDVTHESSALYSIGHSTLFMEGLCNSDNCYFNFSIRDAFSKPLWNDARQTGLNFDFGNAYGIDHDFREPVPYQNPIPRLPR